MAQQTTIAKEVSCRGLTLHGGGLVRMTLHPASAGSGIVFFSGSLATANGAENAADSVRAEPAAVSGTAHATTLSRGATRVSTVEHLMAALHAFEIDNLRVVLSGGPAAASDAVEVPVMDGSAEPFVRLLETAGVQPQLGCRRRLRVLERVAVEDGRRRISIEPGRGLRIDCAIDFPHPAIGRQRLEIESLTPWVFEQEIARARTFGFLDEVAELRRHGLARGGSLDNAVVLDHERVLNPEGLRWPDEFVRHKVLDLIGDLALLGYRLDAHVRVERGGHGLHQRLLQRLLDTPGAWQIEEGKEAEEGEKGEGLESRPFGSVPPAPVQNS